MTTFAIRILTGLWIKKSSIPIDWLSIVTGKREKVTTNKSILMVRGWIHQGALIRSERKISLWTLNITLPINLLKLVMLLRRVDIGNPVNNPWSWNNQIRISKNKLAFWNNSAQQERFISSEKIISKCFFDESIYFGFFLNKKSVYN